jgi:hypothetical protein
MLAPSLTSVLRDRHSQVVSSGGSPSGVIERGIKVVEPDGIAASGPSR